jgi:ribosomal protein S11
LHLDVRGTGRGRRVVRKELKKKDRAVRFRTDSTQDPHNGCRRPKPRRI